MQMTKDCTPLPPPPANHNYKLLAKVMAEASSVAEFCMKVSLKYGDCIKSYKLDEGSATFLIDLALNDFMYWQHPSVFSDVLKELPLLDNANRVSVQDMYSYYLLYALQRGQEKAFRSMTKNLVKKFSLAE